jgi:hypothetical protein
MLAVVGILSVLSGAMLACTSRQFPAYARAIEIGSGVLLISGLALASRALPAIF